MKNFLTRFFAYSKYGPIVFNYIWLVIMGVSMWAFSSYLKGPNALGPILERLFLEACKK